MTIVVRARSQVALLLAFVATILAGPADAVEVVLNLDPAQSSLSSALYVAAVDTFAASQDAPTDSSLTTTFSGSITLDVDDPLNPTSIRFLSAHAIAANSGNWLPDALGGTEGDPDVDGDADPGMAEPANYGWFLDLGAVGTLYGASRNTVLSTRSTPRDVIGGEFDPLGILFASPEGTLDGNVSSIAFGDDANTQTVDSERGYNCTDVFGDSSTCGGQQGAYSVEDGTATLSLPIEFMLGAEHGIADFNFDDEIDTADYVEWRDNLGTSDPFIDVDGSGTVDQGDYEIWRAEFGSEVDTSDDDFVATFTGQFVATVALSTAAGAGGVPEPTAVALAGLAALAMGLVARPSRR